MRFNRFYSTPILTLLLALAPFGISHASLEEVTVYADLGNRSIGDIASSVSIWDQNDIRQRNAQHIDQLLATVPNAQFSGGASRGRFVQIRGVGDIEQFVDPKAYPNIGLNIDGIELNGIFGAGLLFDTEQVEVLRGPQGTRFGASALAGAINIVSTPSDSENHFVELGYGKFNARQAGIAAGYKVGDALSSRLSLHQYRSDGYIENDFLNRDNTGEFDEFIAKKQFAWSISDAQTLGLTLLHIDNDNGYDAFSLNNSYLKTISDQPGHDQQRVTAAALNYTLQLTDTLRIENKITALGAGLDYAFDEDWVNPDFCGSNATCLANQFSSFDQYQRDREEYTEDLRLVGEEFVLGIYFQKRNVDLERDRTGIAAFHSEYDTQREALYGQWTPSLSGSLDATLGARVEHFSDDYSDNGNLRSDSSDKLWSAEAGLTWTANDSTQIYALVSRGNKAGGVNTDASSNIGLATAPIQAELENRLRFDSESLTNIELGSKFTALDGSLKVNSSLFYNKRNNPQFETFVVDFPPAPVFFLFVGYQDNASSAESHGVELEFDLEATSFLTLRGSAGYIESRFKGFRAYDFDQFAFVNISDKDQPRAPSYQYHLAADVSFSDSITATLQLEGNDGYQYAYYFDEETGNINLLHANLVYSNERFSVNVWAKNLLDKEYEVQGLYFANDPNDAFASNNLYTQAGEPRNFGITARVNW